MLHKPSELVGLVKNGFNSMLNLGLYFQRVVGYFNIYTELVTWNFFPKLLCMLFDLVHLPVYFIDFLIGGRHVSSL